MLDSGVGTIASAVGHLRAARVGDWLGGSQCDYIIVQVVNAALLWHCLLEAR